MLTSIELKGARTHNLKNISVSIEHGTFTVVTGVSGSGKSSLAFDTLYAEGQRRYVESLSTYARQFLERMERPDIDSISGVLPAIALEQKNGVRNARSTVGTATEIHDFLRLLFAKVGQTICPDCKRPVRPETPESVLAALEELPDGARLIVLAPAEIVASHLTETLVKELVSSGYFRLWDGRGVVDLEAGETPSDPQAICSILVDRLKYSRKSRARLQEALQTAFTAGRGRAEVLAPDQNESFHFSTGMMCDGCRRAFPTPEPHMFSFYSPLGACPECEGFGRTMDLDIEKVIPNPDLCVDDGAIAPWNSTGSIEMYDLLRQRTTPQQIPRLKPIRKFTDAQYLNLLEGVGKFSGIRGFFNWLERRKYKVQARVMLARYRAYTTCSVCSGARLRPDALNVRIQDRTISDLAMLPVEQLDSFLTTLELGAREREVAGRIYDALLGRIRYLCQVGLGYLTLDRTTRTLSGGEAQRINLATSLGAGLTQTLYVLDEPTVGLHSRDTERLISVLHGLREIGNTVIVVEHDLEVIRSADRVIDLGPGAGEAGGEILYDGPQEGLAAAPTPTGHHIKTYSEAPVPSRHREPLPGLIVRGARGNNLKNVDVEFPLGLLCCVVGVSGSGKTTLVRDTLVSAYRRRRDLAPVEVEPYDEIEGLDRVTELHWVDQSPLGRSTRSNPLTYVKAYDAVRKCLAGTREARAAGLAPKHFSFNVDGGRCPTCKGAGTQTIDMHFMADIEVICESCDGRRFREFVLAHRWRGKNIDDILGLTVSEAVEFFAGEAAVLRAMKPLRDVGLSYLRLGQTTTSLSGGEAQRLKLAGHLARMRKGDGIVFIFDEPTTGLHPADLTTLLGAFHRLIERGCSLIVIEHNLDLIASADWIIELGPEGGEGGGRVIAEGRLADVVGSPESLTGRYLKARFGDSLAAKAYSEA